MKLRIKGNSIRLRLGRSEVAQMITSGFVEESTTFDPAGRQRLTYRLVSTPDVAAVSATFESATLIVRVPTEQTIAWASTDRIGIEASQPASDGLSLRILIEKDLECIDAPAEESQADAYPRAGHGIACASKDA
jgi:hypothetical protein